MLRSIQSSFMLFVFVVGMNYAQADNSSEFLNLYMRNFPVKPAVAQPVVQEDSSVAHKQSRFSKLVKGVWAYLKEPFKLIPPFPVTEEEKHRIISHQLHATLQKAFTSVIASSTYYDLNILHNDCDAHCSLVSLFDTHTACGKCFAAYLLANPTTHVNTLEKRQAIIRFFLEHEEIYAEFEKLLQEFAEHEIVVADFFKSEASVEYTKGILPFVYWGKWIPFLDFMDESLSFDHAEYLYSYPKFPLVAFGVEPINLALEYVGYKIEKAIYEPKYPWLYSIDNMFDFYKRAFAGDFGVMWVAKRITQPDVIWKYVRYNKWQSLKIGGMNAFGIWSGLQKLAQKKRVFDFLHKKMNKVAVLTKALKSFSRTLQSYPELNLNLECASLVHKYAGDGSDVSPEMKELLELLETSTFTTESQWSLRGRVKRAHHLFEQVCGEMADAFIAIGEIDAYVSAANLVKKYEGTDKPFTFAQYDTESTSAVLELQDMWNPLVSHETVITNSIALGVEGLSRNVVLTGPNAGGKTTFLKGVTTAVMFGQTLGITSARFLRFTPFGKINTYVSIVDNIAAGQSLFMAEVARVRELLKNTQENHAQNIFTFSIIDELFSGTEPAHGKAASYAVAKNLGGITTSIVIISSHFIDAMSKLEQDTQLFRNYKVNAEIREDKTIYYPFTVVPGVSSINVVDAILRQNGFDDQIIEDFEGQLAA